MNILHSTLAASLFVGLLTGAAYGAESLTLGADGKLTITGEQTAPHSATPTAATAPAGAVPVAPAVSPVTHPTMPRPSAVTADRQAPIMITLPYRYMARTVRSPFMAPEEIRTPTAVDTTHLPDLRRHPLGDFTLVGIVWTQNRRVAMVSTPAGKGYSVRVGTRIGNADGRVRRISRDAVIIEEQRTDVFGETKKYETVLALRPEEAIP